jgi:NAD+--asparagine ADP-ribosyltransferase
VRKDGAATVALYNVLGQKVRTLFERSVVPGRTYEVRLSGQSLPSGTYFLQLAAPSGTKTRQVAIVK